jgi:hypothetical protein
MAFGGAFEMIRDGDADDIHGIVEDGALLVDEQSSSNDS